MPSTVDVCNLSLSHLGEIPNISSIDPPEGSPWAEACSAFLPIALGVILELHDWTFASKRQALTQYAESDIPGWDYRFALPSDCVIVREVFHADQELIPAESRFLEYVVEGDSLYANEPGTVLRYTSKVVDLNLWSGLAINALSWLLASYASGPITKDPKIKDACYQNFMVELNKTIGLNANIGRQSQFPKYKPGWLKR